ASPTIASELPQTSIGAVIGALTWLPPRTLLSPSVRLAVVPPRRVVWVFTAAPPAQLALEAPTRDRALPQAPTGRSIGALTWLPPSTLFRPEVRSPVPRRPEFSTDAPPLDPASASPSTPTALPLMSIGRETGMLIWLPPPMEPSPSVISA